MKSFNNPSPDQWPELIQRPTFESEFLESTVLNIINRVKKSGDAALKELTSQFDGLKLDSLNVQDEEINTGIASLGNDVKDAIRVAAANIRKFHAAQKREQVVTETTSGVVCWRKYLPIEKVGIYIPGGTAPLFSTVLMLGIPSQLAGCKEVILCSPPDKNGKIHPAILFAASLAGINKIFKAGGAQAIAAMAYGTESISSVYKIFGPGNQYVTKAKQLINADGIAIDLPAGPSEVLVIADKHADASFVAADLLSQAEHGTDSQVVLLSTIASKIAEVQKELELQLDKLPRKAIAYESLKKSLAICFPDKDLIIDFANAYAPEHLIINTVDCDSLAEKITNAGSVFLGPYSPEAVGDYASGTNHTLPTNGFARSYSGVSLESFMKTITYQKLTEEGLKNIGPSVEILAAAESLDGHKEAISVRLNKLA